MSKISICAIAGVYHEVDNKPCQDAVGKYKNGQYSAVVLCDGAGSVEKSELASELVTEQLPKYLCDNFKEFYGENDEKLSLELINYLRELSAVNNIKLDCTLLAIVTNNDDRDLIIHVGDGAVFSNKDGVNNIVSYPENGEESNITYFLSGNNLKSHIHIYRGNADAYLLTSDGISGLLYDTNGVKEAVPIMFNWICKADETTVEEKIRNETERFFKQYTLDDISVAILKKGDNYE